MAVNPADYGPEWGFFGDGPNPFVMDGGGPMGGTGGGGGGGFPSPFIPTFGQGGGAQGFFGGGGEGSVGGFWPRRRLRPGSGRMAFQGGAQGPPGGVQGGSRMAGPMSGRPAGPGGLMQWAQQQGAAQGGGASPGPFEAGALGPIGALMQNAFLGGDPNYGGAFSLNPPSAIMAAMRGRMVDDAGAQQRAARLGLQARGDADPSTYGFQALMSDLQGQRNVAQGMNQADLSLRQQQLENYWRLLSQLLGGQISVEQTERSGRWGAANQPSPWGQVAQGAGGLAGAFFGGR